MKFLKALTIVAIAGIAFGLYSSNMASKMKKLADEKAVLADEKTKLAEDILAEYKDKQANQSRFYAQSSMALLESGNRRAAVLVASQALPSQDNDRPYVPEAEYALSSALHAYDVGHDMEYDRGCVEYKLKLCDVNLDRIKGLTSQMNFRLNEGSGECDYYIGDNNLFTIFKYLHGYCFLL